MECPVCNNKNITPFATQCSGCGADVVAFPLLDDLEEQCVVTLKENVALEGEMRTLQQHRKQDKRLYRKKLNRMFWFLLLLPIMFFWCGKKNIPVGNAELENKLRTENAALTSEVKELRAEIETLKQPKIPKQVTHVVKKNDSLSKIAKLYLGEEAKWKILHKLNPDIANANFLNPGDTIVIKLQ